MYTHLSNTKLHSETVNASKTEKAATVVLLKFLSEVGFRKLFLDFGHSTLHKYVMHELGYSESEAWTRIQAMRLVRSMPEVEVKIESGMMSLCNASILQSHLQNTAIKLDSQEMKNCIKKAEELPSRKLRQEFKPDAPKEKKIILHERLLDKIKKLQEIWSDTSELEIFEALVDEKIRELELTKTHRHTKTDSAKKTRYIPVSTKRQILERSRNRCEHVHAEGKRCEERRYLEFDHIKPYALGGNRSPANMRILCRNHNQQRSIETFGNHRRGSQQ
ncbi:MAG TPA: HNH endonuclease signature motif containing protein [Bacteriovoracaceae bacterium]|nr:HNH endonuclease signature motif containing protein [Bacteriovoracaceae bacterium]